MASIQFKEGVLLFVDGRLVFCDNCPCDVVEDCGVCDAGTTPAQYQVTVSGLTNDACGDCVSSINGTHTLSRCTGELCVWYVDIDVCSTIAFPDKVYRITLVRDMTGAELYLGPVITPPGTGCIPDSIEVLLLASGETTDCTESLTFPARSQPPGSSECGNRDSCSATATPI